MEEQSSRTGEENQEAMQRNNQASDEKTAIKKINVKTLLNVLLRKIDPSCTDTVLIQMIREYGREPTMNPEEEQDRFRRLEEAFANYIRILSRTHAGQQVFLRLMEKLLTTTNQRVLVQYVGNVGIKYKEAQALLKKCYTAVKTMWEEDENGTDYVKESQIHQTLTTTHFARAILVKLQKTGEEMSNSEGDAHPLQAIMREATEYFDGYESLKHEIIGRNLRLVIWVANILSTLPLADRLSEGADGLMRAVDAFRLETNNKFSTYAVWWIRQRIRRAHKKHREMMRKPETVRRDINRMHSVQREYVNQHGSNATPEELAKLLGWTIEHTQSILMQTHVRITINSHTDSGLYDAPRTYLDPPEHGSIQEETRDRILTALCVVPPRERTMYVLKHGLGVHEHDPRKSFPLPLFTRNETTYGVPMSCSVVGKLLGVTKEFVRQKLQFVAEGILHPKHPYTTSFRKLGGRNEGYDDDTDDVSIQELEKEFLRSNPMQRIELCKKLPLSSLPVDDVRIISALYNHNYWIVGDILPLTKRDISSLGIFRDKEIEALFRAVRRLGVRFSSDTTADTVSNEESNRESLCPEINVNQFVLQCAQRIRLVSEKSSKNRRMFTIEDGERKQMQERMERVKKGNNMRKNLITTFDWYQELLHTGENVIEIREKDEEDE